MCVEKMGQDVEEGRDQEDEMSFEGNPSMKETGSDKNEAEQKETNRRSKAVALGDIGYGVIRFGGNYCCENVWHRSNTKSQ
jgi:hypothetical protein